MDIFEENRIKSRIILVEACMDELEMDLQKVSTQTGRWVLKYQWNELKKEMDELKSRLEGGL